MSEILFLAHRVPYPPSKGDKIRSWHLLSGLARRCNVHLGAFVDDPADWDRLDRLKAVCGELCLRPLTRRVALARAFMGLARRAAMTTGYYRDRGLSEWTRELARRRRLDAVFAFSSSMAPYALAPELAIDGPRIIDFCDVDSDKWRQYATAHAGAARWIYAREARLLEASERRAALASDATLVSAEPEAVLLRRIAPQAAGRIRVLANGVDAARFDPAAVWPNPYPAGCRPVVFTGAMDYYANVDAVRWFAEAILAQVRAEVPQALFAIVGSNPTAAVRSLARPGAVLVTGWVDDVRPYLAHAAVVVAPLRIARGVQNKVLEALAMARPLVATTNAVQGIPGAAEAGVRVRDDDGAFTTAVISELRADPQPAIAGRRLVLERYAWQTQVDVVADLLLRGPHPPPVPVGAGYVAV
jgi:sugar transferase (PEP-CTERM/EpsH1 system associated)